MIEARVFTDSLDNAKEILYGLEAEYQGRYKIDDAIYRSADNAVSLTDEFLRLRVVPENIWDEKPVILALKQTELRQLGKTSHIPLKLQFDTKAEAEEYYNAHLADDYVFDFAFSRVGWQYVLSNGDVVDLEILEDTHPSIEFKSDTDEGVKKLLGMFAVSERDVIKGPSVTVLRQVVQPALLSSQ